MYKKLQEAGRLLARSQRRIHGDPPNIGFNIEIRGAVDRMYTTKSLRNIPSHCNGGGACRVLYEYHLMTRVTRPVATYQSQRCLSTEIFNNVEASRV